MKRERKALRIALVSSNFIACGSLVVLHNLIDWYKSAAFTWGLPLIVAAIIALVGGIFTLKRSSLGWAVIGLVTAVAAGIYLLILLWASSWTMS